MNKTIAPQQQVDPLEQRRRVDRLDDVPVAPGLGRLGAELALS